MLWSYGNLKNAFHSTVTLVTLKGAMMSLTPSQVNATVLLVMLVCLCVYLLWQKKETARLERFVREGEIPLILSSVAFVLRNIRVGEFYDYKLGHHPLTFKVLHIEPELLVFEVGISQRNPECGQGRWEQRGWVYEIPWFSNVEPALYSSPVKAAQAMEKKFLQKRKLQAFA